LPSPDKTLFYATADKKGYGMDEGNSMQRFNACLLCVMLAVIGLSLLGLTVVQADESSEERLSAIFFKRIAVAPFLVGHRQPNIDEALDDTLSCPINEICVEDPSIQSNAGLMLMRMVHAALKRRFDQHVVPLDQVLTAYTGIRLDGAKDSPRTMALQMGESLSADLMLMGTIWRYRDRGTLQGFPDKPASVAFALYVVESKTGRQIWRGVFDEAQEIALRDMAKFTKRIKMGLKWLSADELARHGVQEVFRPFPPFIKVEPNAEAKTKEAQ
jgi:hypothetical protein